MYCTCKIDIKILITLQVPIFKKVFKNGFELSVILFTDKQKLISHSNGKSALLCYSYVEI